MHTGIFIAALPARSRLQSYSWGQVRSWLRVCSQTTCQTQMQGRLHQQILLCSWSHAAIQKPRRMWSFISR